MNGYCGIDFVAQVYALYMKRLKPSWETITLCLHRSLNDSSHNT